MDTVVEQTRNITGKGTIKGPGRQKNGHHQFAQECAKKRKEEKEVW